MENYIWLLFVALGVLVLNQLASIARSLQGTEAMVKRLLSQQGIEWKVAVEPSAKVKELALDPKGCVPAIKAYRAQTGLGLKEAKTVIDELFARNETSPRPGVRRPA